MLLHVTLWIRRNTMVYATRTTAVTSLILPASGLEKYLFAWFNSFLGGFGVWLLAYWAANGLFEITFGVAVVSFFSMISGYLFWNTMGAFILFHMVVFWCYVAFGRRGAAALVGAFLSVILFYGLLKGIAYLLIGGATSWEILLEQTLEINVQISPHNRLIYRVGWEPFTYFVTCIFMGLTWGILMVSGYFKFKERQIK